MDICKLPEKERIEDINQQKQEHSMMHPFPHPSPQHSSQNLDLRRGQAEIALHSHVVHAFWDLSLSRIL